VSSQASPQVLVVTMLFVGIGFQLDTGRAHEASSGTGDSPPHACEMAQAALTESNTLTTSAEGAAVCVFGVAVALAGVGVCPFVLGVGVGVDPPPHAATTWANAIATTRNARVRRVRMSASRAPQLVGQVKLNDARLGSV
jgi:hypothetical protein